MIHLRIPKERIGVLIGKDGRIKKFIEEKSGVRLLIDSAEGDVQIDHSQASDPSMSLVAGDIVKAIGRGFSPARALLLLDDDVVLEMLDIRDYVGKKTSHVVRVRSRIIGTKGKTRTLLEELTGTHVSVYGNTVAIIGNTLQVSIARRALDMLMSGSKHATVYRFLEGKRAEIKIAEMGF